MNQEHSNQFHTDTLSCGLRIISAPSNSNVVYCGIAIDAGTRDELPDENGLAHFCEHLTFKGTQRRSSRQVINQMECVGGDLNAYTGKEELRDIMAVDRIITDNTGRLFAFSHIPDDNFKKVSAAIKTEKVKIFENQQKKAAGGKIGFAILYTTNQVVAADYTDLDPVSGIYNHKYIDFAKFLPENDL